MKKRLIILTFCLAIINSAGIYAQLSGIGNMLSGSVDDGEKLMQAYLKPYANAFGANLNGAWFNTAKVHKIVGFDLTFSLSASFVPKADKEFDISTLGLSNNPAPATSPTVAGKKETGAEMNYNVGGRNLTYELPKGTGWGIIPSPMLQLGIGLVKGTDITFRYVPDLTVGDYGDLGLWGVGIKHSLKQWIPAVKLMPFFHLSAFVGYTQLKTSANLNLQPEFYSQNMNPAPTNNTPTGTSYDNQKMEMTIKGLTGSVLASFDFPVITIFGAVGFSNTNANIKLAGNYPLPQVSGSNVAISPVVDPLDMKISESTGTKPRFNGGVKLKMAIITFHVDYTYSRYSLITAGLGISVR